MASTFIPGILPERSGQRSAPPAPRPATATSATVPGRRTVAAHLVANALAVVVRHRPPLLAAVLAEPLAVVLRHLPPLLAHFLTHLAALVRRNLCVHGSSASPKG